MPELTDTTHDVTARLLTILPRLHHTLKRDRLRLQAGDPASDTDANRPDRGGQYRLLGVLHNQGRLTTQGLADALEVSPPTVSAMIRRLADQSYVSRARDRDDQRIVWITITDEGRAMLESERLRWRAVFLNRFDRLSDDDQELIRRAIPALERLLDTDPPACNGKGS